MAKNGMGSHEVATKINKNDEWLTPVELIKSIGEFDLDPCSPIKRPWDTAKKHYNIKDNGLEQEWDGRVWCNPPYGREAIKWLSKLSNHNNGVALIFARTETKMFFSEVWDKATSILFLEGRLTFYNVNGEKGKGNAGAPSCLIAYGRECSDMLENSGIKGKFIKLKSE